jgi:2-octaprenyl-3-methyl-6-methoxy-1,4-benzoquinol hydroxylase
MKKFDVIIVGGGMVGSTVACALGNSSLRVAIIEQILPDAFSSDQPHDLRISALSIASKNIIQAVGAWDGIIARRSCPFKRMRVWETAGDTEFSSDDIGCTELGFIVENRVTQLALLERIEKFDNIELIAPIKIKSIDYSPDKESILQLDNGQEVQAKLLVAADGGNSRIRQSAGIGVTSWDYKQHAFVIYVETDYGQQDITWQRFVSSGPQAFLPLSGHYGSIVWYNSTDEIKRLKLLSDEDLISELTATFPECLGRINKVLGKASFPLKRQHAQQYIKQGVALVGDAAHMINPLAGQGVNIGLLDAAALAEALIEAANKNEDISSVDILQRYEKMRRNENLKMMTVMDAFYRVFSNDVLPLRFFRNMGLGLAERLSPVKNKVVRMAIGLEGKLPKLALGKTLQ